MVIPFNPCYAYRYRAYSMEMSYFTAFAIKTSRTGQCVVMILPQGRAFRSRQVSRSPAWVACPASCLGRNTTHTTQGYSLHLMQNYTASPKRSYFRNRMRKADNIEIHFYVRVCGGNLASRPRQAFSRQSHPQHPWQPRPFLGETCNQEISCQYNSNTPR